MTTEKVIDISGVSKSYGSVRALNDISLSVDRGELFGLIGPDGAGKSTLYRIMTTLLLPDSGRATVLGRDVVTDYKALRREIGYMPERFSLYSDMTVNENLEFFASVFGVKVEDNYELIAPIFGQLKRFPNRKAGALSGGMKQKLALSCALIHSPRLLLLDEPTTGVDAVSRSEFWDMLAALRSKGITIVVSTSYMDEAARCERIALINGGRIFGVGTPDELIGNIGEQLYAVSADRMYALLEGLRGMTGVKDCYTFGATIHVVVTLDFNPVETRQQLESAGLNDVSINPVKADVEDLFIKLMQKNEE